MLNTKVSDNIHSIMSSAKGYESKVRLAAARALNKTALWLKSQAAKEISQEKQVKLNLIRKRLRITKARTRVLEVIVRANLSAIKASAIGNMKQNKTGTRAGKYQFTGSFIAVMSNEYRSVFQRKGRTALPIQEVKLSLEPQASQIMDNLIHHEVEKVFAKYFNQQLRYI